MPSSTSPSEPRLPAFALGVLLVALVSWAAAALYTLHINPEIQYFVGTHRVKQAWAEKMSREHDAKLAVYGGSSCEFSIDCGRLLETHQMPAVNLGRGAGMGASILTLAALEELRAGDTLIAAIEPGILTEPLEPPALGVQFSFAVGHTEWFAAPAVGTNSLPWPSAWLTLRPGGYHTFTMLGKLARRQRLYRYHLADLRSSGFNQTPIRLPVVGPAGHGGHLSPDARELLRALRAWCEAHRVRVAYSLPWSFTPPDQVVGFQKLNAGFLIEVAEFLPVLQDPRLGAYTVRDHFADTALHLTEAGAAVRTDELAGQVKGWRIWTVTELRSLAEGHPPEK